MRRTLRFCASGLVTQWPKFGQYGFAKDNDTGFDVFVHIKEFCENTKSELGRNQHNISPGMILTYDVENQQGKANPRAKNVAIKYDKKQSSGQSPEKPNKVVTSVSRSNEKPKNLKSDSKFTPPTEEMKELHKTSVGKGVVKTFDLIRGFGFVKDSVSGVEYFIDRKSVHPSLREVIVANTEVVFAPHLSDSGRRALMVSLEADGGNAQKPNEYKPREVKDSTAASTPTATCDDPQFTRPSNAAMKIASSVKAKVPTEAERSLHNRSSGVGKVESFNPTQSFGFIVDAESGLTYFFDKGQLHKELRNSLKTEDKVVFQPKFTRFGLRAGKVMTAALKVKTDAERKEFIGEGTICDDGTTTMYTRKDGVSEFHRADGVRMVKYKDGRLVTFEKEYVSTAFPTGMTRFRYLDGSVVTTLPDGTSEITIADGVKTVEKMVVKTAA